MNWYASIEMSGVLTDAQIEHVSEDRPDSAVFDGQDRTAQVRITVDAGTCGEASRKAVSAFGRMARFQKLIADGVLSEPYRLTVENEDAFEQSGSLLSTAAVARRLGVSQARVRQLKHSLDFPRPFKIPGAAGDFYDAAAIDAYRASRRKSGPSSGKPRATDAPMLDLALQRIAQHTLTGPQRRQVERALAATGGRHVRAKAGIVIELLASHPDLVRAVFGDSAFHAAWRRAIEINESHADAPA